MADQQSQQGTELNGEYSRLNNAVILSPGDAESTPSTKKYRRRIVQMIEIEPESDEEESWQYLLTKSVRKQGSPQGKTPSNRGQKTAQLTNKQGCKYDNMCPICLSQISETRGSLSCQHQFCFSCIQEWCATSSICPCCRTEISSILKLLRCEGRVSELQRIPISARKLQVESQYDFYLCYMCGLGDNEHVLLICDQCDFNCCHVYCDPDLDSEIPEDDWFCLTCRAKRERESEDEDEEEAENYSSPDKGIAARTRSRESTAPRYRMNNLTALRSIRRARR